MRSPHTMEFPYLSLKRVASIRSSNVDKVTDPYEIPVRLCNYVDVYYRDRIRSDDEFSTASASASEIKKLAQFDLVVDTQR